MESTSVSEADIYSVTLFTEHFPCPSSLFSNLKQLVQAHRERNWDFIWAVVALVTMISADAMQNTLYLSFKDISELSQICVCVCVVLSK